ETLTFRGSYGQGFRAPGLNILTQKTTFSAEPVNDPVSCQMLGEPDDCSLQVDTYFQASPNLASEQSTQWSVGFVWDPLEWLDISVDSCGIEVVDSTSSLRARDIITSGLDPAAYGPIPPGFSIGRRDSGAINYIIAGYANEGTVTTKRV